MLENGLRRINNYLDLTCFKNLSGLFFFDFILFSNKKIPDTFYHVYNRANGNEKLIHTDDNYLYFLKQWQKYISPIAETYAYCLLPNHFHFLIRIKDENSLAQFNPKGFENIVGFISQKFSNLFNSYTKAFNKQNDRKGSLFSPIFKRKEIKNEDYLTTLICYIQRNPIHHKIQPSLNWKYSSYNSILSTGQTNIQRNYVLKWFNWKEKFI